MPVGAYSLELSCTELINPNRTATYLMNAQDSAFCVDEVNSICPSGGIKWQALTASCGCDALLYDTPLGPNTTPVLQPTYTTPALDPAPWYDVRRPNSAHFLGFMLEKVEQLQDPPISRNLTNRATNFGGGTIGTPRRGPRKVKYTVLAFGCDECALDEGFRWLSDQLVYQCVGDECTLCDATVRTCCPSLSTPPTYAEWDTGRWTLKKVAVIDGPRYEAPPIENLACNVRRISFTLASESPFAYKCPVVCLDNQPWILAMPPCPPAAWICGDNSSICCSINSTSDIGEDTIKVQVVAREDLTNLTISVTPDPFGYVCNPATRPAGYAVPDACAVIRIPLLEGGNTLDYDTGDETITVTRPGGQVVDGVSYIDATTGNAPTFPTLRCNNYCVCISSDRCSYRAGRSTASISSQHRELAI